MPRSIHAVLQAGWAPVALVLATGCSSGSSSGAPGPDGGDASVAVTPDAGGPVEPEDAGSPEDAGPDDASSGWDGDATTYFVSTVRIEGPCSGSSCSCLPQALLADPTGQVPCAVFFELAASDTCAAHGLTGAAGDVVLSLTTAEGTSPSGVFCVLPQLPSSDWVDASCAGSSQAGWCYATGPAAGSCPQVLLASPTGFPPDGSTAFLGCGTTAPIEEGDDGGGADGSDAASGLDGADDAEVPDAPSALDAESVPPVTVPSVGTPCTPSAELSATFGGFNYREVTLDEGNPACPGAVCLVNHFQGLTSCPYGQDPEGNPANGALTACSVPGASTPVIPNAAVGGETVQPWCTDRLPASAVACSCRCANVEGRTDDGATYCGCPSGYTCSQVVPEIESSDPRAGGYCVKAGTAYVPLESCRGTCAEPVTPCL